MKAKAKIVSVPRKTFGKAGRVSETVFRGRVFCVARHVAVEPGGVWVAREVVHHGGSAVILPRLDDARVVLIRQFRLPAAGFLWELPAGSLDRGETPLQAARRELAEETGYRTSCWRKLVEFFPSPGFLDEKMTLFLAQKLRAGTPAPESDEKIRVQPFSSAEWQDMIRSGQIRDAKTLVGLLYWQWIESQE